MASPPVSSRGRRLRAGGHGSVHVSYLTTRMRRTSILQAIGPLLIIAAGVAAFVWLKSLRAPPETKPAVSKPPPVRTLVLAAPRRQFNIRIDGQVVPRREVTLSAEIAGRVVSRPDNVRGGRYVAQGTQLLQLDPGDYELQLRTIDLQVTGIDLDLQRLTTETAGIAGLVDIGRKNLELATNELERIESLLEKKTATPAERDRVKRSQLSARNALKTLENQQALLPIRRRQLLSQRQGLLAQQEQAQRDLRRTRITAPFDGILTRARVEVGDFVRPGDILVTIEEADVVEVACRLRSDDLHWLRDSLTSRDSPRDAGTLFEVPVTPATVTYRDARQAHEWAGRLTRFDGQGIDPNTRTIPCRVAVNRTHVPGANDAATTLMRGTYVTVTLPVSPKTTLIEIPNAAVRPNRQIWSVSDDRLVIHEVEVARVLPESILIRSDRVSLRPGDHVVVSPLKIAYDGMPVRLRPAKHPNNATTQQDRSP